MSHYFEKYESNTKSFWESCDETFAHLEINKWLNSYESLVAYWKERFLTKIDFKGKSVIEYGIGGGYLGKCLFSSYSISKYVGIDISERSIQNAKTNLEGRGETHFFLSTDEWYKEKSDIFVSQACIQHFPSVDYLDDFLTKVNQMHVKEIILQIRFSTNTFSITDRPVFGAFTNFDYIKNKMTNFELVYTSNVEDNGYQYGILKKGVVKAKNNIYQVPQGFYEIKFFETNSKLKRLENNTKSFVRVVGFFKKIFNKIKRLLN
jgi:hypothetical protein